MDVSEPINALSVDHRSAAFKAGVADATIAVTRAEAAEAYARALGTSPSYVQWHAMRAVWIDGYHSVKAKSTVNAGDKAFERFARYLNELFGLERPKAASPAAEKKAIQREAAKAALVEKYKSVDLPSAIEAQYQRLAKRPSDTVAEKKLIELKKASAIMDKVEKKAEKERVSALKEGIRDALKVVVDIEALEAVLETLEAARPDEGEEA